MSSVNVTPECKHLIILAAKKLKGSEHRAFIAEVAEQLCFGSPRLTETEFNFGRHTVELGMHEKRTGLIPIPFLNYDKVAQLLEHKLFKRPTSEVSFFHPSQSASTMAS